MRTTKNEDVMRLIAAAREEHDPVVRAKLKRRALEAADKLGYRMTEQTETALRSLIRERQNPARPGRRETPPFLVACVDRVAPSLMLKRGGSSVSREDVSRAFAICTASGRKSGQLTKSGPLRMTPKGAAKARGHRAKLTLERLEGYEEMLASVRQPRRMRVVENPFARGRRR